MSTNQAAMASKHAIHGPIIPFSCEDAAGTRCHNDPVISSAPAVSSSKAQSASESNAKTNVKCFAFCLGISNANSGSAADSNSRTNSPGDTAVAQPVTPKIIAQPDFKPGPATIVPFTNQPGSGPRELMAPTSGIDCIDNTGFQTCLLRWRNLNRFRIMD